mgnify:CR=1 FL=1
MTTLQIIIAIVMIVISIWCLIQYLTEDEKERWRNR